MAAPSLPLFNECMMWPDIRPQVWCRDVTTPSCVSKCWHRSLSGHHDSKLKNRSMHANRPKECSLAPLVSTWGTPDVGGHLRYASQVSGIRRCKACTGRRWRSVGLPARPKELKFKTVLIMSPWCQEFLTPDQFDPRSITLGLVPVSPVRVLVTAEMRPRLASLHNVRVANYLLT